MDLSRIMPPLAILCGAARAALYGPQLVAAMAEYNIDTSARAAMFLANVCEESGRLSAVEEGLNYRAERLRAVWPSRFRDALTAAKYAHNPEGLANFVYANREGNGDAASGDGWRFRGAGLKQITFRNNHSACAKHFGIPLDALGDWLRTPKGAAWSAAWFWSVARCDRFADSGDFDGACDAINLGRKTKKHGDAIGFARRQEYFEFFRKAFA